VLFSVCSNLAVDGLDELPPSFAAMTHARQPYLLRYHFCTARNCRVHACWLITASIPEDWRYVIRVALLYLDMGTRSAERNAGRDIHGELEIILRLRISARTVVLQDML
jgi:hypothetical protein